MLNIVPCDISLQACSKRETPVGKVDKIAVNEPFYKTVLAHYDLGEITPDIDLFSYEKAINENRELAKQSQEVAQHKWLIGKTGQGDSWLIDKQTLCVEFYDHDQGEFASSHQLSSLNITFAQFLQMAFLFKELETRLDQEADINMLNEHVKSALSSLAPNLYQDYPFDYFA